MKRDTHLKIGAFFLGVSIFAFGLIHLITGNFPNGFIPLTQSFPGKQVMAYLSGISLAMAGVLIPVRKLTKAGAIIAASILLILLILVHIPILVTNINNGGEWTGIFELFSIFGGLLLLLGITRQNEGQLSKGRAFILAGHYIYASGLCVFGIVHLIYEKYIISWIPGWLPNPVFWTYLVPVAFFCAFISLAIQKMVRLSSLLLALMFFIFFITVNLPRAIGSKAEADWTGTFIALAMSGTALLIAATATSRGRQNPG
jgi:uncharacterized membrane protein YphA (DoxX/SURF4 family)